MPAAERFAEALSDGDLGALGAALSPRAVLRSPVSERARFEGRERIVELYRGVLGAVEDVRARQVSASGDVRVLHATGRARGRLVDETIVARIGPDGLVAELTLYVRDLAALATLAEVLGPAVAPTRARALALRLLIAPIAWLLRAGDGLVVRLAGAGR